MSHIYVYSPSSAVRDKSAFRRGLRRLQSLGHEVEIDEAALSSHMRFAGDDATRLAAIGRAAASGADVALISRGGYGLTRILPDLPFRPLAKAIERGTQFVGLSDFTALQCALLAKTGATTWAGPALGEDFGAPEPDEIMQACFEDLLCGQGEGSGWRLPASDLKSAAQAGTPVPQALRVDKALLWGGNLSVLSALVGTPFLPPIKSGVLFLEDVNEHPYRIERQLTQLLHAGVLAKQKAILLGAFNRYKPVPHDRGFKLQTVVAWLRSQVKAPVLTGLPFGHVPTKVLLPVGQRISLMVEGRDALLYWG
ncbi:MAG TPA: LD-carboxypeptidase [Paracoccaceae bacterium]|uniref:LD-carboxypeptidase n=1 Tax=Hydrogenophaga sp. TaxID=1904254 RepID=UPI002C0BDB94|nr:LD-carboxypeptidase [Hydrogenophaga sp.]HMO06113.1 LD-carboxypeptidase [Paracoccaceae bacterium]HMP10629.1 LD-carboxypeptidase [Hydrogenophaga sp.]